MRLGLFALCHQRGLGVQAYAFHRHLKPAATLGIVTDGPQRQRPEMYADDPDATLVHLEQLTHSFVTDWMRRHELDVLLTAESFFQEEVPAWARAAGVKTAIHANREFLRWINRPRLPRPDLFVAPSVWDLNVWPEPWCYLPLGVEAREHEGSCGGVTFVHPVGVPAMADRDGTRHVSLAADRIPDVRIVVRAVTRERLADLPAHVRCELGEVEAPDHLYRGADVLLLPRRYGGQSLKHGEALGRGMPVIGLDREPERVELPGMPLVPCEVTGSVRVGVGEVDLHDCRPEDLAATIACVAQPSNLARLRDSARLLAERRSWERLGPVWLDVLQRLCAGEPVERDPAGLLAAA